MTEMEEGQVRHHQPDNDDSSMDYTSSPTRTPPPARSPPPLPPPTQALPPLPSQASPPPPSLPPPPPPPRAATAEGIPVIQLPAQHENSSELTLTEESIQDENNYRETQELSLANLQKVDANQKLDETPVVEHASEGPEETSIDDPRFANLTPQEEKEQAKPILSIEPVYPSPRLPAVRHFPDDSSQSTLSVRSASLSRAPSPLRKSSLPLSYSPGRPVSMMPLPNGRPQEDLPRDSPDTLHAPFAYPTISGQNRRTTMYFDAGRANRESVISHDSRRMKMLQGEEDDGGFWASIKKCFGC